MCKVHHAAHTQRFFDSAAPAAGSLLRVCPLLRLQRGVVDTQLIAHDKEVYDIAWGGVGVFASVSADGSVRVFDLR